MENSTKAVLTIPNTTELGKLESMEPSFKMTASYKTQEEWVKLEDQPVRAFYMGMKEIPNEDGESVNCAVFMSQKEVFLAAQMVLVDAVKNLEPNTPLEITYRGKKKNKTSNGSTNIFEVVKLA